MSTSARPDGGRRNPSMADVAALAGVSHQTVSRVVNDHALVKPETRSRVQEAMAALGYRRNHAARALATNRSGLIGLVATHLGLYGPGMIATAVQDAAHDAGYGVAQAPLAELSPAALRGTVDRLLDRAVEAVVVAVAQRETLRTVAALDLPVPVVLAQGVAPGQQMAAGIDQSVGGRLATEHLVEVAAGRGAIAHVTGPMDWVEAQMRRDGWHSRLDDLGAEGRELPGDWSARSGYDAGREIARDPTVSGVFAGNDVMALGVLRALHEAGRRVPHDRRAVELALRALQGEAGAASDLVVPELVVRGSTVA